MVSFRSQRAPATLIITLGALLSINASALEPIGLSECGRHFAYVDSQTRFVAWGFNYDHDDVDRLLEEYWHEEWDKVVEDLRAMKELGANTVRIHLQVGAFMTTPDRPNQSSIEQLTRLVALAEETELYLYITGLGCYHKEDVPEWYDQLDESDRWAVQARFWETIAQTCKGSPAVFAYDLMNEPILAEAEEGASDWLGDAFGDKHFVQRITLDLAGRTREEVAKSWVDTLIEAIRQKDSKTLTTVGVIPWVHVWPKTKPLFYSEEISENLDFVSVHFYPEQGEVDRALTALEAYDVGNPLVIAEMGPLNCGIDELEAFIDGARPIADGYLGFYWGETYTPPHAEQVELIQALYGDWLGFFQRKTQEMMDLSDR